MIFIANLLWNDSPELNWSIFIAIELAEPK